MNWKNNALLSRGIMLILKWPMSFSFGCLLLFISASCGIYSFSGVSVNAKSISISEFYNNTDLGPANIGQTFTNRLRDYMLQNTSMAISPDNGELQLEGIVTSFVITDVAPTAGSGSQGLDASAISRLTITVKVTYINTNDDALSFRDRSFSFFENINNNQSPDAISEAVINKIFDQIILDIFNATVANW